MTAKWPHSVDNAQACSGSVRQREGWIEKIRKPYLECISGSCSGDTVKLKKGGEGVGERSTSLGPSRPKREDFCRPRAGATPKSNAISNRRLEPDGLKATLKKSDHTLNVGHPSIRSKTLAGQAAAEYPAAGQFSLLGSFDLFGWDSQCKQNALGHQPIACSIHVDTVAGEAIALEFGWLFGDCLKKSSV